MHSIDQIHKCLFLNTWRPFCFAFHKKNIVTRELRSRTLTINNGIPHAYCALERHNGYIYAVDGYSRESGVYIFDLTRLTSELSVSPLEVVFLE
jgi:hypothetical protein